MITVKIYGLISVDNSIGQLQIPKGTVRQVLNEVIRLYPGISNEQLMQSIMFINKKQVMGSRRYSIVLKDGDELALLNPVGGG